MSVALTAHDVLAQYDMQIAELGRMMVNFELWIDEAHAHGHWEREGELSARRLAVQQQRSALMVERFSIRRRQVHA